MGLIDKFHESLYRPVLRILLIGLMIIVVIRPLGIPMKIGDRSRRFAEVYDELPEGGLVFYGIDMTAGGLAELRGAMVSSIKYLFSKQTRIIFVSLSTVEGPMIYDLLMKDISVETKEYGVDYVHLGYVPGMETAFASFARDIRSIVPIDYYGTPLDSLPVMTGVNSANDFDLVITFCVLPDAVNGYIRQWVTPYNVKFAAAVQSAIAAPVEPYYPTQIIALVNSAKQMAELELALGLPSYGVADMDVQSSVHIMILFFIFLGNIITISRKGKGGV